MSDACCCANCAEKLTKDNETENNIFKKLFLFRMITGGVLFIAGLIAEFAVKDSFVIFGIENTAITLSLLFCLPAYLLIGGEVIINVVKNISKGIFFDENFLMTIATIGAFAIGEYPEAVAVMLFYQIGEAFEGAAIGKSRKSISALMNIRPDFANLKTDDGIKKVDPAEVLVNSFIVVRPGEKVPLDGIVCEGYSSIDTRALTGESAPRDVEPESPVLSGTVNLNGLLTIRVTKPASESTVSKILEMMQNAVNKKSKVENFITKFARIYTPVVVACAFFLAIVPPFITGFENFHQWLNRALIFLVVSCPCALVVSIPLSFFGGIGAASKRGILIKGSNYMEALSDINTVVFDKTGTITQGVFSISEIQADNLFTRDEILFYAAYAEYFSKHPAAIAIQKAYKKPIDETAVNNLEEVAGCGVKAVINGKIVLAGNKKLMQRENISYKTVELKNENVIYVAIDGKFAGLIMLTDTIKKDSAAAILRLKKQGVRKTIMLTGDTKESARIVAEATGIDEYYAEILPHQKVERFEIIEKEKKDSGSLVFVGDGINDAPVIARSDVGIAMGALGQDAAIEAADVVLMTDELSALCDAVDIARKTKVIVGQNIVLSLGVKGVVLVLGALGLANIWFAVFGDVGVLFLAVLNAVRALRL